MLERESERNKPAGEYRGLKTFWRERHALTCWREKHVGERDIFERERGLLQDIEGSTHVEERKREKETCWRVSRAEDMLRCDLKEVSTLSGRGSLVRKWPLIRFTT